MINFINYSDAKLKTVRANNLYNSFTNQSGRILPKILRTFKIIGLEASVWISALLYLAFIHIPGETHFTICPIKNLGFDFCPGCGLGNSVSYIFHGDFYRSFTTHPLGLFAIVILLLRIIFLIKNNWSYYGKLITTDALPRRR